MELNWFQSLLYGLLSGIAELIPVSAEAHRKLYLTCLGFEGDFAALRLAVRLGCLAAVVLSSLPLMMRMQRERRLSRIPRDRRKRPLDMRMINLRRLVSTAAVPVLLGVFASYFIGGIESHFWFLAMMLAVNGVFLFAPQHMPQANKDSLSLSAMDAFIMGLAGASAALPGISRMGAMVSTGVMRGADRRYALDMSLLLMIPALLLLAVLDATALTGGIGGQQILCCFLGCAAAFAGASASIFLLRFLAFKLGFSLFSYYSWGIALFTFILYLIV